MNASSGTTSEQEYNVLDPASHALHECRTAQEFIERFEAMTGRQIREVTDDLIPSSTPRAIFVAGSIPLGMGTRGSDVDMIVLVDDRDSIMQGRVQSANSSQEAAFCNEADPLLAGTFLKLQAGVLVDIQVAQTPAIHSIYKRLRRRSPELSETEIRILGRLRTGWLLWESEGYLQQRAVNVNDPTLLVYCCTRNFVTALTQQRKAAKALELHDTHLALQLGRAAVEMAYLAYFASEGLVYLGAKWLAQLGFARGARERIARHPLLEQGVHFLFPEFNSTEVDAGRYLQEVEKFVMSIRGVIERQVMFRIAFKACAQINSA